MYVFGSFFRLEHVRVDLIDVVVPAVALTAFASPSDREEAPTLGVEEHLAKPTSASELSKTVARLVGRAA